MLARVKQSEGMEGFVLSFQDTGEMFKMKSEWYFERSKKATGAHYTLHTTHYTLHTTHYTLHTTHYTLHTTHCTKTQHVGSMVGSQEKDIWQLVLDNKLDDIAITIGQKIRERMEQFAQDLFLAIHASAERINAVVADAQHRGLTRAQFVHEIDQRLRAQQGAHSVSRGQYNNKNSRHVPHYVHVLHALHSYSLYSVARTIYLWFFF